MSIPVAPDVPIEFIRSLERLEDIRVVSEPCSTANQVDSASPRGFSCAYTIYPQSQNALRKVVEAANEYLVRLYVISRGHNYGLGARSAPVEGCVLVTLESLQRITEFDGESGSIRLEPGVSFQQLAAYLEVHAPERWQAPAIGGPADASVLANALERGDGIGQLGDRARHICDMTVVLGNGEVITTGHENINGTHRPSGYHAAPAGPSVEGLFLQSNLGIVSTAVIRLAPCPIDTLFALTALQDETHWTDFIVDMKSLIIEGLIEPRAITIWNGVKRMARIRPRAAWAAEELSAANLQSWSATCFFQSFHPDSIAHKWTHAKQILGERAQRYALYNDIGDDGEKIADHTRGYSDNQNLRSLYWEKSIIPEGNLDPDRDRCGSLWVCVAVPFTAHSIKHCIQVCNEQFEGTAIDANLGFQAIDYRALHMFVAINYDRESAEADEIALALHDRLCLTLPALGFPLVRLGIESMVFAEGPIAGRLPLLKEIKSASDPNGVLAPGRYLPDPG